MERDVGEPQPGTLVCGSCFSVGLRQLQHREAEQGSRLERLLCCTKNSLHVQIKAFFPPKKKSSWEEFE